MKKTASILVFILVCACYVAAREPQTNEKNALRRGLAALLKRLEVVEQGIEKRSNLTERVKMIISEHFGVDEAEVVPNASFENDLGADYLDISELIMVLEEEFDTEIPDEEAERITTVQAAIDYITKAQY